MFWNTINSVEKEGFEVFWRRDCIHRTSTEPLGCFQQTYNDGNIVVDECICEGDFCNEKMPEFTTSTTTSTTTRGSYFDNIFLKTPDKILY